MKSHLLLVSAASLAFSQVIRAEDEVKADPIEEIVVEDAGPKTGGENVGVVRGGGGADIDPAVLRGGGANPGGEDAGDDVEVVVEDEEVVVDDDAVKTEDEVITITDDGAGPDVPLTVDAPGDDGEMDPRILQSGVGVDVEVAADSEPAVSAVRIVAEPVKNETEKPAAQALDLDEISMKALDLAKGNAKARGFAVAKKTTQAASASKAVKTGKRVFLK
jgi:hypothetical protein